MGFRTTVLLYNDYMGDWSKNPHLGQMIARAANFAVGGAGDKDGARLENFGAVVECAHADTQTIAVLDSYRFSPLAHSMWRQNESNADRDVRLLKEAADKLGYRLVAKSK